MPEYIEKNINVKFTIVNNAINVDFGPDCNNMQMCLTKAQAMSFVEQMDRYIVALDNAQRSKLK